MIAVQYKEPLKLLWERFWSGGIANPLTAIEQISYLLFLKMLDVTHAAALDSADPRARWSHIRTLNPDERFHAVHDIAFPFLKELGATDGAFARAMEDAVFVIPTPGLLSFAFDRIDELKFAGEAGDVGGDLYEFLLSELGFAGKNGQFRTPRHVVRAVVELMAPKIGDRVCDPAAGTGGFLVGASQWILKDHTTGGGAGIDGDTDLWTGLIGDRLTASARARFHAGAWLVGYDFDVTMVRLAAMNLLLHGIADPQIRREDALALEPIGSYDVVLANPPFTGQVDATMLVSSLKALGTTKSEILFMERITEMIGERGRAAVILPDGALFSSGAAPTSVRRRMVEERLIGAVVSLPPGCFRPYSGVKTSVLVLDRARQADDVWFYEVEHDGFTLDDRRQPEPLRDDLRFVAEAWRQARGTDQPWSSPEAEAAGGRAWTVSLDEIAQRGHSLAANDYRKAVEAPAPSADDIVETLDALREHSQQVDADLARLRSLLLER